MKIVYFFICLFFLVNVSIAQMASNFNNSKNWSMNKHEIFFLVGANQFLGDLGGLNRIGTKKSLADIDMPSTRGGIGFGYRFRFHPRFATTTQLYFGLLAGNDALTEEVIRRSRNLSFRSPLLELTQKLDIIIYANEKTGARYSIHGLKGARAKADLIYVFTGISGFYFNPQTKINGKWTNLRPLRTEGQGLPGGAKPYSNFNFGIPFGIGLRIGISDMWRIGIEASYTKTFTDYLDDVSTEYYSPTALYANGGANAVYAANPAIENHSWFQEGMQRGNKKDKDAYFFLNVTVTRNVTYSKMKSAKIRWKGRTKF